MASPLRDQILNKYIPPTPANTAAVPSKKQGNSLRDEIVKKYVPQESTQAAPVAGNALREQIVSKYSTPIETKQGTVYVPNNNGPRREPQGIPARPGSGFQPPPLPSSPLPTPAAINPYIKDGNLNYSKGSKTDVALKVLDRGADLSDKFFRFLGGFFSPVTTAQKFVGASTTYGLQKLFPDARTDKSFQQLYDEAPTAADVVNKGGDAALSLANREDIKTKSPVTVTAADLVHVLTRTFFPSTFLANPVIAEGLNRLADKYGGNIKLIDQKPAYQLAQDVIKFTGDTSLEIGVGGVLGSSLLSEGSRIKVSPTQAADFYTGRAVAEGSSQIPDFAQQVLKEQVSINKPLVKRIVKEGIELRITEPTKNAAKNIAGTVLGGSAPEGRTVEILVGGKRISSTPLTEQVAKQLVSTQFAQTVDERALAAQAEQGVAEGSLATFVKENGGKLIKEPVGGFSGPAVAQAEKLATSPLSPTIIDSIKELTPLQGAAFGRKIIDTVTERLGLKVGEATENSVRAATTKGETILRDVPSSDGRPAQVINGKIELYLPTLKDDLQKLAQGQSIRAHEGAYTTVYKSKAGESMEQLASRYVSDVILHEQSHLKTMTAEDIKTIGELNNRVAAAQATRNQPAITSAKTELDTFMRGLEDKANAYLTSNRTGLETEVFGKATSPLKGASRSFVDRALGRTPETQVVTTQERLLKQQLKIEERVGKRITRELLKERQSIEDNRKVLRKYAKILPASERVKVLAKIEQVKTNEQALKIINDIQTRNAVVERKYLQTTISKELDNIKVKFKNGLPSNVKYDVETQKTLESIKKNLNAPYAQAQLEIQRLGEEWAENHPNELLSPEVVKQIDLLNMQGIEDQTPAELRKVLSDIKQIKETGLTTREAEKFNRQTILQRDRDTFQDVLTGGDLSKLENTTALPNVKLDVKNWQNYLFDKVADKTGDFWWRNVGLEELLDYLSQFDKASKPYESFLNRSVLPKLRKATNAEADGIEEWTGKMGDLFKDSYNLSKAKEVKNKYKELLKEVNLGNVTLLDGSVKPLIVTKADALQLDMWFQDPTLESTFRDTLLWGDDVRETLDNFFTSEDRAFQEGMFALYKEHGYTIDKQFVKDFGYNLQMTSERFSSAPRDVDSTLPESVLLAQESRDYLSVKNGSLKKRVQSNLAFKNVNVFQNYIRYITRMEHYKGFSDTMQYLNGTLFHPDTLKSIKKLYGPKAVEILNRFGQDIARGGVDPAKVIPLIEDAMNGLSRSFLGLPNFATPIKQLTGIFNFAISDLPIGTLALKTSEYFADLRANYKFLVDNSGFFKERYASETFQKDINTVLRKKDALSVLKKQRGGYDRKLFSGIKLADQATVGPGMYSAMSFKYEELTGRSFNKNNFDETALKEAINYAEDLAQRVQEGSALYQKTDFERSGSLYRLLTMFSSQPNKMFQQFVNAGRNYKRGRGSKGYNLKRMSLIGFVIPLIYNEVSNLFQEDKYKDSQAKILFKSLISPLTGAAIIGNALQSALGWASGESFDYTPTPLLTVMTDLKKTITNFYIGIDQGKEKNINNGITYLADFIGRLKGVPTGFLTKRIRKVINE